MSSPSIADSENAPSGPQHSESSTSKELVAAEASDIGTAEASAKDPSNQKEENSELAGEDDVDKADNDENDDDGDEEEEEEEEDEEDEEDDDMPKWKGGMPRAGMRPPVTGNFPPVKEGQHTTRPRPKGS